MRFGREFIPNYRKYFFQFFNLIQFDGSTGIASTQQAPLQAFRSQRNFSRSTSKLTTTSPICIIFNLRLEKIKAGVHPRLYLYNYNYLLNQVFSCHFSRLCHTQNVKDRRSNICQNTILYFSILILRYIYKRNRIQRVSRIRSTIFVQCMICIAVVSNDDTS